jgi:isoleucyl-tRNA synthetase
LGNPIPVWISDDGQEVICITSIAELEKLSGVTGINDLHREYIDGITIPYKMGKGVLKRIPEVYDCWFESGAMPFSQSHYPFSINDEEFMKGFPANFIAEGLD